MRFAAIGGWYTPLKRRTFWQWLSDLITGNKEPRCICPDGFMELGVYSPYCEAPIHGRER